MADVPIPDGSAPGAPSPRDYDAPPLSADSNGQLGAAEVRSGPPAMTEEMKARLDKVIYSDVGGSYNSFNLDARSESFVTDSSFETNNR